VVRPSILLLLLLLLLLPTKLFHSQKYIILS
jgi:hypothetical protein